MKRNGEDAVTTLRTRTELEPEDVGFGHGKPPKTESWQRAACAIYQTTDVGDLPAHAGGRLRKPGGKTMQYAYDQCGRLRTGTAPDGSQTHYAYDLYGRLLSQDEPWAESGRRITRLRMRIRGRTT